MLTVRPANQRGVTQVGWLDSRHTFSFGEYHDPSHMGFGVLRVINDDRVRPGMGFGTHPHQNMEIVSYVLEGELSHQDSLGNGSVIRPGELQRMTAGTGVLHSERNPSSTAPVHFLQIWIIPAQKGLAPGYEQRAFSETERQGRLRLVGSSDGREGSVRIHQDVAVYSALVDGEDQASLSLAPGRRAWVHVARGEVTVNGQALGAGDGLALEAEPKVELRHGRGAEVLVFDLP